MKKKPSSSNTMKIAVIGASLAGVAATAYFFFGPKGKKHRQHAKSWAIKMKGDVVEKLEQAKEITEPIYREIVDSVSRDYVTGKKATRNEIEEIAKDLKKHWSTISGLAMSAKQKATTKKTSRVAKGAPEKAR